MGFIVKIGMLFTYFHFKANARINTADNILMIYIEAIFSSQLEDY